MEYKNIATIDFNSTSSGELGRNPEEMLEVSPEWNEVPDLMMED